MQLEKTKQILANYINGFVSEGQKIVERIDLKLNEIDCII
jgi:hypothetical protein